jgi:hypothetical protein
MNAWILPDLHEPPASALMDIDGIIDRETPEEVLFLGDRFNQWSPTSVLEAWPFAQNQPIAWIDVEVTSYIRQLRSVLWKRAYSSTVRAEDFHGSAAGKRAASQV